MQRKRATTEHTEKLRLDLNYLRYKLMNSMASIIKQLSKETINQIAAGEVVENPASVVKELIENALDGGATEICIEIEGGGFELIRVADDGRGMHRQDLALAVLPHTTSKIENASDLFALSTMGFRGEALASIASVSKLVLLSASEDGTGAKLVVEAGQFAPIVSAARQRGTTVEVGQLFFNVPARKKFQKNASASLADILRVVTGLSLAFPEVSFQLKAGKRTALSLKGSSFKERVKALYGDKWIAQSFEVQYEMPKLSCYGFISYPEEVRINRAGQQLFINQRLVECPLIAEGVKEGYATRIPSQRFPLFLLHLKLPKELIDANVHPQKREIRLRDGAFFRQKIIEIVADTLNQKNNTTTYVTFTPPPALAEPLQEWSSFREESAPTQPELTLFEEEFLPLALLDRLLLMQRCSKAEQASKLLIIDMHALLFRLKFDELMARFETKQSEKQGLLLPLSLLFTPLESTMITTHIESIETLGFAMRPIGHGAFLVDGLPPHFPEAQVKETLSELALELQTWIGKPIHLPEKQRCLARIVAAQVKQREGISLSQALSYFKEWMRGKERFCPLGRPILAEVGSDEIKKNFLKYSAT